jgi:hypothetical protein
MFYAHFNKALHYICLDFTRCKISTNIMPPHVKMSIKHDMGELFLNFILVLLSALACHMMSYGPSD